MKINLKLLLSCLKVCSFVIAGYCQPSMPLNLSLNKLKLHGIGLVYDSITKGVVYKTFPAKNQTQASLIWASGERWTFLNLTSISGTKNGGAATVDIVSDFLGPVRLSLLGNVAASKNDSSSISNSDKQKELFLSGGGTAALVAAFIGPTLSWGKSGAAMLIINPKLGLNLPALGTETDDSNANFDLGTELRVNAPLSNNNLGLFGAVRGAYVTGGNAFYSSIGLPEGARNPFFYSQVHIGLTFPNLGLAILWVKVLNGPSSIMSLHENGKFSLVLSPKK